MTNTALFNRFVAAYRNIAHHNENLADFYVSEYWNEETKDWDWFRIGEGVVAEIEKDSMYQSNC